MPATTNIIDQLGTSWKLTVQEFAVYSYTHPTFGYLEYVGRVAWECGNTNTVWLTQQGSLPDNVLPPSICIRPKYDAVCGDNTGDANGYTPPSAKCLCKDPECSFQLPLYLTCAGVTDTCLATFVASAETPTCDAAGPVYWAECTLNGVLMKVLIYCDGTGQWMADVLNDGVLCDSCIALSPTFCPLVMGGGSAAPCPNDCFPCIGPDCEPTCDSADCSSYPDTMTVTFSGSACLTGSTTITRAAPGSTSWTSDAPVGTWDISAECAGGNFTVSPIDSSLACAILPFSSTAEECDPVSIAFGTQNITDIIGCTCVGDTVTLVVSA